MAPMKEQCGIGAMDIAKGLLDKGYMAPTVYFPFIVPECMMVEPTETESKETFLTNLLRSLLRYYKKIQKPYTTLQSQLKFEESTKCMQQEISHFLIPLVSDIE